MWPRARGATRVAREVSLAHSTTCMRRFEFGVVLLIHGYETPSLLLVVRHDERMHSVEETRLSNSSRLAFRASAEWVCTVVQIVQCIRVGMKSPESYVCHLFPFVVENVVHVITVLSVFVFF